MEPVLRSPHAGHSLPCSQAKNPCSHLTGPQLHCWKGALHMQPLSQLPAAPPLQRHPTDKHIKGASLRTKDKPFCLPCVWGAGLYCCLSQYAGSSDPASLSSSAIAARLLSQVGRRPTQTLLSGQSWPSVPCSTVPCGESTTLPPRHTSSHHTFSFPLLRPSQVPQSSREASRVPPVPEMRGQGSEGWELPGSLV